MVSDMYTVNALAMPWGVFVGNVITLNVVPSLLPP